MLVGLATALPSAARPGAASPDAEGPVQALSIPQIQGRGPSSAFVGQQVRTTGVVTLVLPRGFFMQDPRGDGDPATSDGVFVYTAGTPKVDAGDAVSVTGRVTEYAAGARAGRAPPGTLTELVSPRVVRTGRAPPVAALPLVLPLAAGWDTERLEGMRVVLRGPRVVLEPPRGGGRGAFTASCGPRPHAPTDLGPPGPAAQRDLERQAACRVLLDPPRRRAAAGGPEALPLRAGQALGEVTGVVGDVPAPGARTASVARIHPDAPLPDGARPPPPPTVGGTLRVAGVNAHNFFVTLNDGRAACGPRGTEGCRGARTTAQYVRQRDKLVEALVRLDADVVGLMEIENRPEALEALVEALNARAGAGAARYAAVGPGLPTSHADRGDAIQVALVYRPSAVTPVGTPVRADAPVFERPPLAQAFRAPGGAVFTVVVSHLKSKRCQGARGPDSDQGDGQGCYNARRTAQAQALNRFARTATRGDAVLLIGDLNAHAREDPVRALTQAGGWADLLARFAPAGGPAPYTYVHDGVAGRLDHALASAALGPRVTGAAVWHINADSAPDAGGDRDAERSSDHDPVLVGLDLAPPKAGRALPQRPVAAQGPGKSPR